MANETKVNRENEEFTEHFADLCNTISDVDNNLLPYFVQENIIPVNDLQEFYAIAEVDQKVQRMMTYISGPLQAGNTEGFYKMLKIMEDYGNQATQNLAEQIRKKLSATNHIAVMVTGITGEGKSSACNFLMGENKFEVGLGMLAITSKSDSHSTVLNNTKLNIIDTPGFCEDSKDDAKNIKELGKAVMLARNGVHAIALVVNVSHRFTSSQVTLLKELELLDELWPFMFIIFSAAKSYGATDEEQRKRIYEIYGSSQCPDDFKKLLDRVEKRFMMLESSEKDENYRTTKLKEFFAMVNSIFGKNKRLYSNKLFERAIELYEELKDKEKNKEKSYLEAISKAEVLAKHMSEEIEKMRIEQQRQLQLMKEEARSNEERLRKRIRDLENDNGSCNLL